MKTLFSLIAAALLAIPVVAQQQVKLPSARNAQFSARNAEGKFQILVHVDGEAFIYVKGTELSYLPLSGAPLRDGGSNYTQGIPQARFGTFNMVKVAGRGEVSLHEEPSAANGYTAVVRVADPRSGSGLYDIRLDWTWNPANPNSPPAGRITRALDSNLSDPRDYNRAREGAFKFRGIVDDVTVLYIRSDQVRAEDLQGRAVRAAGFEFTQPLPNVRLKTIDLIEVSGRGRVELMEKPWEGNKFQAVVMIVDEQRSNAEYSFKLAWTR